MKLVIDKAIPFIKGVFEPFVDRVLYLAPAEIVADEVRDADALVIRTRTRCCEALLEGSGIKAIATATIGTDHIDLDYCREKGIAVFSSAGCNAGGVGSYVISAVSALGRLGGTIGIIGVGNTGGAVERLASGLGLRVLRYDPPRAEREGPEGFCTIEDIQRQADIVTVHLPLKEDTRDFIGKDFFSRLERKPVFINASRGECVSSDAVKWAKAEGLIGSLVIDTFPNEPNIDRDLAELADICSPHIAGYSLKGKAVGTTMAVRQVADYFGIASLKTFEVPLEEDYFVRIDPSSPKVLDEIKRYYDILSEKAVLLSNLDKFEYLRQNYRLRPEIVLCNTN